MEEVLILHVTEEELNEVVAWETEGNTVELPEQPGSCAPKRKRSDSSEKENGELRKNGRFEQVPEANKRRNAMVKQRMKRLEKSLLSLKALYSDRFNFFLQAEYTPFPPGKEGAQAVVNWRFGDPLRETEFLTSEELKISPEKICSANLATPSPPYIHNCRKRLFQSVVKGEGFSLSRCTTTVCTFRKLTDEKAVWIGCASDGCDFWIHAKCAGFPNATQKHVDTLPLFFCPTHNQ